MISSRLAFPLFVTSSPFCSQEKGEEGREGKLQPGTGRLRQEMGLMSSFNTMKVIQHTTLFLVVKLVQFAGLKEFLGSKVLCALF